MSNNHEKSSKQNKIIKEKDVKIKLNKKDRDLKKYKSQEAFFESKTTTKKPLLKKKISNGQIKLIVPEKGKIINIKRKESYKNIIKKTPISINPKILNTEKKIQTKLNKNIFNKVGFKEIKYKQKNKFMSSIRKRNFKKFNNIFYDKSNPELHSEELDNNLLSSNTIKNEINNNFYIKTEISTKNIFNPKINENILKKINFDKYNTIDNKKNINKNNKKNDINRELLLNSKKGDKEKVLELLSNNSIDINFQNENGWSSLHFACDEGNLKIVDILIKFKIDLNLITNEKKTSLHLSVMRGYFDISKLLIENGADINCLDNEKNLPIHICAMEGHNELLNYLLEKNSKNINEKNLFGKTALDLATKNNTKLIIKKFIKLNKEKEESNINNSDKKKIINYSCKNSETKITKYISIIKKYPQQGKYNLIKINKNNKNKTHYLMVPINESSDNNSISLNRYKNYKLPRKISSNSNNTNLNINKLNTTNNNTNNNINIKKNMSNTNSSNKRKGIFNINITNNYISYLPSQENMRNMVRYNTLSNISSSSKKKKIKNDSNNKTISNYTYNKTIDNCLKGREIFCEQIHNYNKKNHFENKRNIRKGTLCRIITQKSLLRKDKSKVLNLSSQKTFSAKKLTESHKKLSKDFPLYLKKILKKEENSKSKKKQLNNKKVKSDTKKKINKKMIYNEDEAALIDDLDEEIEVNNQNFQKKKKLSKKYLDEKNQNKNNKEEKKNIEKYKKIGPNNFLCLALLGQGSFGEVYLVKKKDTSEYYAMKVLDKSRIEKQNIFKYVYTERNIMSSINNPFIVKLYYSFQTNEKLFLLLEYASGGDLSKQIKLQKRFSEDKAKFYICEVILALGELHQKDIIYRDLKPDNIVINKDGHVLLTDFGLSREGVYNNNIAKSFCGSIAYLAPEMLKRSGHGKAVDWYLLGVLFYEMLVGVPPFFTPNQEEIFRNIIKSEVYIPSFVSKKAQKLLKLLLKKDPNERLGSKRDVDEIKENEYFSGIDWDKVLNKKYKPPKIVLDKQKLEYFKDPILFSDNYDNVNNEGNDLFVKDSNIDFYDKNIDEFNNSENKYEGWSFVQKNN